MSFGEALSAAEAAVYESQVVARYMGVFGDPAVQKLMPHQRAVVAQLGCKTGYPVEAVAKKLPGCTLYGVDNSAFALQLARAKATLLRHGAANYRQAQGLPSPLTAERFTHALALHPLGAGGDYSAVLGELYRVLVRGGQLIVSLPLRGSFPELYDLMREYALRYDKPHFSETVDVAANSRPSPEMLTEQFERMGLAEVDLSIGLTGIVFPSGRDFLDDPIYWLVVAPDVRASFAVVDDVEQALRYAVEAIAKYWSEMNFELTVHVGSISARRL